jgi:hypothetical protein
MEHETKPNPLPSVALVQQHTPEPWHVREKRFRSDRPLIARVGGGLVAQVMCTDGSGTLAEIDERIEANAERIVACVNACQGIPTGTVVEGIMQASIAITSLRQLFSDIAQGGEPVSSEAAAIYARNLTKIDRLLGATVSVENAFPERKEE